MSSYLAWCFLLGMFSYLTSRILDLMWENYWASLRG